MPLKGKGGENAKTQRLNIATICFKLFQEN
jgi:hypothetical protein